MDLVHAAVFDPGDINADGLDASVSSPSKRTSRDTILRMSNLIEPTTTGAQNLDATKAFHDWIIAKDIQSIAEVDNDHTSSGAPSLLGDYQEHFYASELAFVDLSCRSKDPLMLPMDRSERYIHSRHKTHESDDIKRTVPRQKALELLKLVWSTSACADGILFSPKPSWTQSRFTYKEIPLYIPSSTTSWAYLFEYLDYPPASHRLQNHHVRELPCENYPPVL
jgi:hypothetical protein